MKLYIFISNCRIFLLRFFALVAFLISCSLFLASPTNAAQLYFYPEKQTLAPGDTAVIEVRLNTENERINALEFSGSAMELLAPLKAEFSGSIFPFIVEKPDFNGGKFRFAGGAPGGFTGDGIVGRLYVKALREGEASINFDKARAFLHTENLEEAKVDLRSAMLNIVAKPPDYVEVVSKSHDPDRWNLNGTVYLSWKAEDGKEYSYRISKSITDEPDAVPDSPLPDIKFQGLEDGIYYFAICELHKSGRGEYVCGSVSRYRVMVDHTPPVWISAEVSDGTAETELKRFASFVANDNISGIDHYEVSVDGSDFKSIDSPHVLSDSAEVVVLKAIDRAGNETSKVIEIDLAKGMTNRIYGYLVLVFAALILGSWTLRKIVLKRAPTYESGV